MIIKGQAYYMYLNPSDSNVNLSENFVSVNCAGINKAEKAFVSESLTGREDFYIQYLLGGNMRVRTGEKLTMMEEGDFVLYYPHTPYYYEGSADSYYYWVHFTGSETERLCRNCRLENGRIYKLGNHKRLVSAFERMFQDFIIRDRYFEISLGQSLIKLLLDAARLIAESSGETEDDRMNRIIAEIHKNMSEDISVSSLAASEYISEGHLRALFHKRYGMSPKQYITSLRIYSAKQLLEGSNMTVAEVAQQVGIHDALYFSRLFRQETGVSPKKYRSTK